MSITAYNQTSSGRNHETTGYFCLLRCPVLCAYGLGRSSTICRGRPQVARPAAAVRPPRRPPTPTLPGLILGAAWYPEHWPEPRWEEDLSLMQAAGIHMVRIAEFAWSTMEPEEDKFEFGWLERAVALAARHDISVVLGTPSAAPPAWLTRQAASRCRLATWASCFRPSKRSALSSGRGESGSGKTPD